MGESVVTAGRLACTDGVFRANHKLTVVQGFGLTNPIVQVIMSEIFN